MNLTNFNYNQNMHSKIKKYEIRTLNDESLQNYMKKDSYVHRFLRSLDHERINEIFDHSHNPKPKSYNVESQETTNTESIKNNIENSTNQPTENLEKR
jgi:hypothetical protein